MDNKLIIISVHVYMQYEKYKHRRILNLYEHKIQIVTYLIVQYRRENQIKYLKKSHTQMKSF